MIDTVTFWTNITKKQFDRITKRSREYIVTDNELNAIKFHGTKADLKLGSFNSNINIQSDGETARIEFSLPKQYLGNNVELLYPSMVPVALELVQNRLRDYYGDFPSFKEWNLIRLDLCYAWKWPDKELVKKILEWLKTFDYPPKSKHPYPTSVMWRGKTFTLKFYLKNDEFIRNELNKHPDIYNKDETGFTRRILDLSEGVFRFEITFRSGALKYVFKSKNKLNYEVLLDKQFLTDRLNFHLNKLLSNLNRKSANDRDVLSKLRAVYNKKKSIRLFEFYNLYFSPNPNDRKSLKDYYDPSTVWRKKRDIASAGVGLPNFNLPFEFDLSIPSKFVVNEDLPPITKVSGDHSA